MSKQKGGFKEMLKLGVILALYSAAACVGLAFVYTGTAKIIAERQQADTKAALNELFNDADEFKAISGLHISDPAVSIDGDNNNPENSGVFAAFKNGVPIGVALRLSRFSYGGDIKLLVGVGADSKISGVKILEHSDTPGLGANAGSKTYYVDRAKGIHFYDQFTGKSVGDPFEPKQDVIAITAATVTSRAVSAVVKAAGEAASVWFAGQGGLR
jgi:electron transport complex protein RnfG